MAIEVTMPDLSTTDDSVLLLRWLMEVGQNVKVGQPLIEIETDKATMEVEAIANGTLVAIHAEPGERVAVGQLIAVIDDGKAAPVEQASVTQKAPEVAAVAQPITRAAPTSERQSMFARNKAARAQSADTIPLSGPQRDVARRLQESKQSIPHYYLNTSINAEGLVAQRYQSENTILWDAFFVKAVAQALQSFERMQYRFAGDKLVRIDGHAVGVAADIDNELFVIPVENAHQKTVITISQDIRSRAERIRQGDTEAKRLGKTVMTISNLGSENIESFTAIINPPEVAILTIGKIVPVPHVMENQLIIQQRANLTLAVDHRVANGKYAAKFLGKIVEELEMF